MTNCSSDFTQRYFLVCKVLRGRRFHSISVHFPTIHKGMNIYVSLERLLHMFISYKMLLCALPFLLLVRIFHYTQKTIRYLLTIYAGFQQFWNGGRTSKQRESIVTIISHSLMKKMDDDTSLLKANWPHNFIVPAT